MLRSGRDWVGVAAVEAAYGTPLRRRCTVDGVRGAAGYAAAHRREVAWAMRKPAWALRKRLIALAVAMSALALQACAFLLPVPTQIILRSGLDLDDEFDKVFLMGGGCPPDTLHAMLRKKHFEMLRTGCTLAANEFVKVIRKHREIGVPAKTYLLSKGGACTEPAKRHWRCVVERVVTTTYCGPGTSPFSTACVDPGRPQVDRFLLKVEIHDPGEEIRADFERLSVRLPEKQK